MTVAGRREGVLTVAGRREGVLTVAGRREGVLTVAGRKGASVAGRCEGKGLQLAVETNYRYFDIACLMLLISYLLVQQTNVRFRTYNAASAPCT